MNKIKLALVAAIGFLFVACDGSIVDKLLNVFSSGKADVDFSIIPIQGSNGEYQYIDLSQNGKIVINPQFGKAHFFRDGLALVKTAGRDGKYGYIDKKGKYVIFPTYEYAQDFSDGVAWVQMENQPPMLVNKKGKILMQVDFLTGAYPFVNGMAKVDYYNEGQKNAMFINKKGKHIVVAAEGEEISSIMNDGLYAFRKNGSGKWGFKNIKGETVINEQFDSVGVFGGIVDVKVGDKWGAIDKNGVFILNLQYDELGYDNDGLFVAKMGDKWGWINKKGEMIINPQFDLTFGFCKSKLAPVMIGEKWAYIDRKGQMVINPQFDLALPFIGDYALVGNVTKNIGIKVGFIDQKGTFVVPPLYDIDRKGIDKFDEYIMEYLCALAQKYNGFSMSYYLKPSGAKFKPYDKLKERKEAYKETGRASAKAATELPNKPRLKQGKILLQQQKPALKGQGERK